MDKNVKYLNIWGNCEMDFLPIFPSKELLWIIKNVSICNNGSREIKILYPKLATFDKFFGHYSVIQIRKNVRS